MTGLADLVVAVLLVAGEFFTLTAAIGLVRLPDLYTRMHAASKAGVAGSSLLMVASGLHSGDGAVLLRVLLGVLFFVLGAPVAAHLIARAAFRAGLSPPRVRNDVKKA